MHSQCRTIATSVIWKMIQSLTRNNCRQYLTVNNNYTEMILYMCVCVLQLMLQVLLSLSSTAPPIVWKGGSGNCKTASSSGHQYNCHVPIKSRYTINVKLCIRKNRRERVPAKICGYIFLSKKSRERMWTYLNKKDVFVCWEKCLLWNSSKDLELLQGQYLCVIKSCSVGVFAFFEYKSPYKNITISPSHKTFLYFGTVPMPHAI